MKPDAENGRNQPPAYDPETAEQRAYMTQDSGRSGCNFAPATIAGLGCWVFLFLLFRGSFPSKAVPPRAGNQPAVKSAISPQPVAPATKGTTHGDGSFSIRLPDPKDWHLSSEYAAWCIRQGCPPEILKAYQQGVKRGDFQ